MLCSVPITFVLGCNLGKLMLLHPAVKQMKYSFSLWYGCVSRGGICIYPWGLSHVSMFSKVSWAWWLQLQALEAAEGSWSGTGSALLQKLHCRHLLHYFFLLSFVTGILVCRDHSWPDFCSLMVSIC